MTAKRLLDARRRRRVPRQFSWIDQRLVRDGHIGRCSHPALALYLFLVTVADAEGLSYYADRTLGERLNLSPTALRQARHELVRGGLVAYAHPLYQVLALEPVGPAPGPAAAQPAGAATAGAAIPIGQVLQTLLGGAR